jgi:hypothetical protein
MHAASLNVSVVVAPPWLFLFLCRRLWTGLSDSDRFLECVNRMQLANLLKELTAGLNRFPHNRLYIV